METEFYGDGQHNGGVYNLGNLNPYIYTYQNPIRYIGPNGKHVDHSFFNKSESSLANNSKLTKNLPNSLQIDTHESVNGGFKISDNFELIMLSHLIVILQSRLIITKVLKFKFKCT